MRYGITLMAALSLLLGACDAPQTSGQAGARPHPSAPETRYRLNAERGQVWMMSAAGLFVHDARNPQRIAVHLPDWQWAGELHACMPDIAIGPKGEAIVTSNVLPRLWRVDPQTLAVTVHALELDADNDKDVGFAGLVYSAEHQSFFAVSQVQGSLWRIDPLLRRAQKIGLPEPIRQACGISLRPRMAHAAPRSSALCLHGSLGGWAVDVAPDQRSGYVRAAGCPVHASHS